MVVACHPMIIRVTLHDGGAGTPQQPLIRGDTLSGVASRHTVSGFPNGTRFVAASVVPETATSIPLMNIRHVALRRFSVLRTQGFVLGSSLLVFWGAMNGGGCCP